MSAPDETPSERHADDLQVDHFTMEEILRLERAEGLPPCRGICDLSPMGDAGAP